MIYDSTGKRIYVGDAVRFRGGVYTIKCFVPEIGRHGSCGIKFEEPQHTLEIADEISVDLIVSVVDR